MYYSSPGFSVRWILQARILNWVAMPSSRGSSPARDGAHVSCGSSIAVTNTQSPGKPIMPCIYFKCSLSQVNLILLSRLNNIHCYTHTINQSPDVSQIPMFLCILKSTLWTNKSWYLFNLLGHCRIQLLFMLAVLEYKRVLMSYLFYYYYLLIAFCLLNKTLFHSILHTFIKIIFIKIPLHFLKLCICPYCLEDKVKHFNKALKFHHF